MESKCHICNKASVFEFRPFCSKRCADIDLASWLNGDYCIPGEDGSAEEGLEPANEDKEIS